MPSSREIRSWPLPQGEQPENAALAAIQAGQLARRAHRPEPSLELRRPAAQRQLEPLGEIAPVPLEIDAVDSAGINRRDGLVGVDRFAERDDRQHFLLLHRDMPHMHQVAVFVRDKSRIGFGPRRDQLARLT
jgi:hypothetical protein